MEKYIDAELLKQILKPSEWGTPDERWVPEHEIGAMLDYFPAADVQEVKHGRWRKERVSSTGCGSYGVYQCSICGAMFPDIGYGYNYCPNCGAKMDEVEE